MQDSGKVRIEHLKLKISLFIIPFIFLLTSCTRISYLPSEGIQSGLASWYGPDFHGKLTSNKEIYNMHDLTAAHKTLPFGTHVMVTNLNNGKSITVRINDRGPFVKGRIIDLSYAAAKALDMVGPGVVPVRIEVIPQRSPKKLIVKYSIQAGAFIFKKNAHTLHKKLRRSYRHVYISQFKTPNRTYYRVRIKADSLSEAEKIAARLNKDGYTAIVFEEQ